MSSAMKTIIVSILLLLVVSCTGGAEQATASVNPAEVITPSIETQNTATDEALPTETATPESSEATPTPPLIALPTLNPQEAEQEFIELLENNGGCKLPCWWGAIPGVSSWYDVKSFLLTIADEVNRIGTFELKKYYESNELEANIFKKSIGELSEEILVAYAVNSTGKIEIINVQGAATERKYQIHQVLSEYGKPEEILFDVLPDSSEGIPVFWIILLYPENGIVAMYEGQPVIKNSSIIICPQNIAPELYLFSTENLTLDLLQFMLKQISWIEPTTISSIDTFPNLSIEVLFNALKTSDGCLTIDQ